MGKYRRNILRALIILFLSETVPLISKCQDSTQFNTQDTDSSAAIHKDTLQYFDEITRQPIFYERKLHDSTIKKIKEDEAYWYADKIQAKQKQPEPVNNNNSLLSKQWFRTLIWILMIGSFIAVVLWYLIAGNVHIFRKPSAKIETDEEQIEEENIFSINYDKEIQSAIQLKDYRLAIRLLYLNSLKTLSDYGKIAYKTGKTNTDYLFQLSGSPFYKGFFTITRAFDYVWYGKFQLSESEFNNVHQQFNHFNELIAS